MMQSSILGKIIFTILLLSLTVTVVGCNHSENSSSIDKKDVDSSNGGKYIPLFEDTELLTTGLKSQPIVTSENEESTCFTTTFKDTIKEGMPIFIFDLLAHYDKNTDRYSLDSITIISSDDGKLIQEISIPELTLFGHTDISLQDMKTMGFELEDFNFDGYKDIRLFDTTNGNYRIEWIYLIWDPVNLLFVNDIRLNEISLAKFDRDKQLIYGMERGSATDHYFSTYRYIEGVPTLIQYRSEEYIYRSREEIMKYLEKGGIKTEITDIMMFCETVLERNEENEKMDIVTKDYIFYPYSNETNNSNVIAKFDALSEIGCLIRADE